MDVLLSVLSFVFLLLFPVILIIGLIKPKKILKWSKKPTRLKVVGWWFLALLLYFVAFSSLLQLSEFMKTPAEMISVSEQEIVDSKYDSAIRRLKKIAIEDAHYAKAQELIYKATLCLARNEMISGDSSTADERLKQFNLTMLRIGNLPVLEFLIEGWNASPGLVLSISADTPVDLSKIEFEVFDIQQNEVEMPRDMSAWFENVHLITLILQEGTVLLSHEQRPEHCIIPDPLIFNFVSDGTDYSMKLGLGSTFVVSKTDRGTYRLCIEETIELSLY